jgi:hypothetical protein
MRLQKKTLIYLLTCLLLFVSSGIAQSLQYSRQNVFIDNPNSVQMAAGVSGTNHLISFTNNENIHLFIYNNALEFRKEVITPIRFIEKTTVRVISLNQYYYLWMRPRYGHKTLFWRIDADGNCTELTEAFQQLLRSQAKNMESGFQLYKQQEELCMLYRTYLPKMEKNVLTLIQLDTGLNITHTRKVMYAFKREEEKIIQETFMPGKDLLVLKTNNSNSVIKLMKVNMLTGLAITNEFATSGYYSQCSFSYNIADSIITVAALLSEPGRTEPRSYVFVSRLNTMLVEQTPFTVLKSQFRRNTSTDFLMVDGLSGWLRIKKMWTRSGNLDTDNRITVYQDRTMPDSIRSLNAWDNNRLLASFNQPYITDNLALLQNVRFSFLDRNLQLTADTLIRNNRDSYTLNPEDFYRFEINNRSYLLMGQLFRRVRGLLMIQNNEAGPLACDHLPVIGRYNYMLSKAAMVSAKAVIIPYLYKDQAGLLKVIID